MNLTEITEILISNTTEIFTENSNLTESAVLSENAGFENISQINTSFTRNTTHPDFEDFEECTASNKDATIYIICYTFIGVFGVFGNLLTLAVLYKSGKALQTTTNIFIVSLAFADMTFLLCTVPIGIINYIRADSEAMGYLACRLIKWLEQFNMCGSVLTMVAMSTERFLAIVYVLEARHLRTTKASIKAVSYVWFIGLVLSIPAFFTPETGYMIDYADWKYRFRVDNQTVKAWEARRYNENEVFTNESVIREVSQFKLPLLSVT